MLNPRSFLPDAWRTLSLIGISISMAVTSVGAQAGNTPAVRAAAKGNAAARPDLAFDVVSIRPAPDTGDRSFATRGDEYRAIGMPLGFTILQAYFPPRMGSKDRIIGAPTDSDVSVNRRIPQRERGERRFAELLEAAASEFAEVGYDAATTKAIAKRASIGAVYQYFPNKAAVVSALRTQ
jgi:hypothetical protein